MKSKLRGHRHGANLRWPDERHRFRNGRPACFPEAALGGHFSLVRDGDVIELDVPGRSLAIEVSPEEFQKRKQTWRPWHKEYPRGYVHFYQKHVEQAHLGADMDFLKGGSGSEVTRDSH